MDWFLVIAIAFVCLLTFTWAQFVCHSFLFKKSAKTAKAADELGAYDPAEDSDTDTEPSESMPPVHQHLEIPQGTNVVNTPQRTVTPPAIPQPSPTIPTLHALCGESVRERVTVVLAGPGPSPVWETLMGQYQL